MLSHGAGTLADEHHDVSFAIPIGRHWEPVRTWVLGIAVTPLRPF